MESGLKGKVAIVTGGSKGIGEAIASALWQEGAAVVITARNAAEVEATAAKMREAGGKVLAVVADMTKETDLQQLVTATIQEFGRIDILVNNAGIIDTFGPVDTITVAQWRWIFEVNVFGVVALTNLVIPYMQQQGGGRIINISSENAEQPDPMMVHYNATKAALNNYSKTLSKAWGKDNILVNTVSPAFIKTPLVDDLLEGIAKEKQLTVAEAAKQFLKENRPNQVLGRPGLPEETAGIVVFLAGAQAGFITGGVFRVDGGSVGTV
ncbi:SDR family NAD(P)-dependent oxidoreductase [Chitinophaga nivalis]|uniref:Glucose 1-dehydrogenase n=1 Tax=Chitinophaga nivalis TaxID=2991709 RepID=A0ABT3IFU8_9BACT|nr:glucose 1-dehydrogenase [Chitinophaga nivalis]MCW3467476.1 glucose 1-dehydrogenase [Chitinophaga nivalis]MCW3482832.1 glucose 1-dehydrogenase [Chitinophaga nivalis]